MKKINRNNEDCSFENKYKFDDLFKRIEALGGSIIRNGKQTCYLGILTGGVLFSTTSLFHHGKNLVDFISNYKIVNEVNMDIVQDNNEFISKIINDSILVTSVPSSYEQIYYISNDKLYDKNGNIVILTGIDMPVHFTYININNDFFENIDLVSSKIKFLDLDGTNIDDSFVRHLPQTLEQLSLNRCNYITNLNDLPNKCPNITSLSINVAPSLKDLSFIYELPNLRELYISDSAYITDDLLSYLEENNIVTNVSKQDVINSQQIDKIIDSIITTEMSDREKIQAVCLYVINNVEYDLENCQYSNQHPLMCVLENGKGVCVSYTYLTNVLLNKLNITTFKLGNTNHAWNLVELDDKYYYIDTTNMGGSAFYNFLLKTLNLSSYYMIDTESTFLTIMSKPENEQVIIPLSLIEDIKAGRNEKDLIEKYGGQVGNVGVILGFVLYACAIYLGLDGFFKLMPAIPEYISSLKNDYNNIINNKKHM